MAADQHPGGYDALMAAITGEPLPPDAGADARGEHRSATADVALLREQLHLLGDALGERVPQERPKAAAAPPPRRRRPFRLAVGVLVAACAGVVVTGLGWLVVQSGSGASQDAASDSAADKSAARPDGPSAGQEAAVVFGTPRYLACARLVAEGTVTAADPEPGTARHRITLRVTHAYAPEGSTAGPTTTFVLDDGLATLAPGDRVLVGALRDRPTADTVITGGRNIATARAWITASLPESRTLTCD
ncbi:hypothetical protein [Streptomyces tendae]|uniref:hypothetical protein n=1 Tax=Streptomyces tendae TaxID=1932 RepID=UPI003683DAF3